VSENVIEASWQALFDSIVYGLLRTNRPSPAATAVPETGGAEER
jgi:hypothetical protein